MLFSPNRLQLWVPIVIAKSKNGQETRKSNLNYESDCVGVENKSRISKYGGKYGHPGNTCVSFEYCYVKVDRELSTERLGVAMAR